MLSGIRCSRSAQLFPRCTASALCSIHKCFFVVEDLSPLFDRILDLLVHGRSLDAPERTSHVKYNSLFAQRGPIRSYHFQSFYNLSSQASSKCCTFGSSTPAYVDSSSAELVLLLTVNNRTGSLQPYRLLNLKQRGNFVLVKPSLSQYIAGMFYFMCLSRLMTVNWLLQTRFPSS